MTHDVPYFASSFVIVVGLVLNKVHSHPMFVGGKERFEQFTSEAPMTFFSERKPSLRKSLSIRSSPNGDDERTRFSHSVPVPTIAVGSS